MISAEYEEFAAALVEASPDADGAALLHDLLARIAPFRDLIIIHFDSGRNPNVARTHRDSERLHSELRHFIQNIKRIELFDPFGHAAKQGRTGFLALCELEPKDRIADYMNWHHTFTCVIDEVRYLAPLDDGESAHLLLERQHDDPPFSAEDIARLRSIDRLVVAYLRRSMRSKALDYGVKQDFAADFDLSVAIKSMQGGVLTDRECEIVEHMLRGHSAKSIARLTEIEPGTVSNHKRNIYAKLSVHSQAQLFNLFLESLNIAGENDNAP